MPKMLLYSYSWFKSGKTEPSGCDYLLKYWGNQNISKVTLGGFPDVYIEVKDGSYTTIDSSNYIAGFTHDSNKVYAGGTISGKARHSINDEDDSSVYKSYSLILRFRCDNSDFSYTIYNQSKQVHNLTGQFHIIAYNESRRVFVIKAYNVLTGEEVPELSTTYNNDNKDIDINDRPQYLEFEYTGFSYSAPPIFSSLNWNNEWFPFLPMYKDLNDFRTCILTYTSTLGDIEGGNVTETISNVKITTSQQDYPRSYLDRSLDILNHVEPPKKFSPPTICVPASKELYTTSYRLEDTQLLLNAADPMPNYDWGVGVTTNNYIDDGSYTQPLALSRGCRPIVKPKSKVELKQGTLRVDDKGNWRNYDTNGVEYSGSPVIPAGIKARWAIVELQAGGGGGSDSWYRTYPSNWEVFGGFSGNYILAVIPLYDRDGNPISYTVSVGDGGVAQHKSGQHSGYDTGLTSLPVTIKASGGYGGVDLNSHDRAPSNTAYYFGESYPSNLILLDVPGIKGNGRSMSAVSSLLPEVYGTMSYESHASGEVRVEHDTYGGGFNDYYAYGGGPSVLSTSNKYAQNGYSKTGVGGGGSDLYHTFFSGWKRSENAGDGGSGVAYIMY